MWFLQWTKNGIALSTTEPLSALYKDKTEESSTMTQVSEATTTMEDMTITGANTTTSSSSPGTEFYFHMAVVVIGVIGLIG